MNHSNITTIKLIAISGKKQAGKDTLCDLLQRNAGVKSVRIGFADAVKEEVAKACGVSLETINKDKTRFRTMLQWWGTDFRRHYKGENYWVEIALRKMLDAGKDDCKLLIIPDLRFLSEAEMLKELNTYFIRVARPTTNEDTHPSETQLDSYAGFDEVILNSGSIADLNKEANLILQKLNIKCKQTS